MSDDVTSDPPPSLRRRPPTAAVVGLAGLAAAIALALLLARGRQPAPRPVAPSPAPTTAALDAGPLDHPEDVPDPPALDAAAVDGPLTGNDVQGVPLLQIAPGGGPDVLAIFTPLRPGSMLGPARIDRISEVVLGRIMVDVTIGDRQGSLAVMLSSPAAARLIHAGPYTEGIHGEAFPELFAVVPRLAEALRANSDPTDAPWPIPAGLRPFAMDRRVRR